MDSFLSICITVYNQGNLLRKLLNNLSKVQCNDFEVVVNDDCSSEDIEGVVYSFTDNRFFYYKNEVNVGHDRNILKAIENAKGKFVFVLRTRDGILPDKIPNLINLLRASDSDYVVCSAVNEEGKIVLPFRDMLYRKGKEATDAHFKMFIHPSGNIYRKSAIDIEGLAGFLDQEGVDKLGFIVHSLIRLALAQKGSFQTVREITWVYANTNKAKDIAQNKTDTKVSVYHPSLEYKRFEWVYRWTKQCVRENFVDVLLQTISLTLNSLTWNFLLSNGDKKSQKHYQYEKAEYSLRKTQRAFYKKCIRLYDDFSDSKNTENEIMDAGQVSFQEYKKKLDREFSRNLTHGGIKYIIRRFTYNSWIYDALSNYYKTYFRKL